MIDPDRKTYWDLLETLMWIATRDEARVAALRNENDEFKIPVVFAAMRGSRLFSGTLPGLRLQLTARI